MKRNGRVFEEIQGNIRHLTVEEAMTALEELQATSFNYKAKIHQYKDDPS